MRLSHFGALLVFAAAVAVVFGLISRQEPRDQVKYGIFVFLSFVGIALAIGWLMSPFPF